MVYFTFLGAKRNVQILISRQSAGEVLYGSVADGRVTLVHQQPGTLVRVSSVAQRELTLTRVPHPAAGGRLAGEGVNLVQHG